MIDRYDNDDMDFKLTAAGEKKMHSFLLVSDTKHCFTKRDIIEDMGICGVYDGETYSYSMNGYSLELIQYIDFKFNFPMI